MGVLYVEVLSIQNLNKKYEKFALKNVSFSIEQGTIMGFIGRNGAGKTTTLKSLLNYVHADSGTIKFFGKDFFNNEFSIKQEIGFVSGGVNYYPKKKLKTITEVTKRFYERWDDTAYEAYLKWFRLDPEKRVDELSEGMKVKYQLALALSHYAKLLILDEPTSGLDPVSRDDLLELFITLVEEEQVSILFSTHITSDLEKCAEYVTYIKNGEILASTDKKSFLDAYRIVKGSSEQLTEEISKKLISFKKHVDGFSGLIPNYPYYVTFFYTCLGIFFVFQVNRENHDVYYMMVLPIRKRDIVKARFYLVVCIELAQIIACIPFAYIRDKFIPMNNQVGIEANVAFIGLSLIMLCLFNYIFLTQYYKSEYKIGMPFVISSTIIFVYIAVAEILLRVIPYMRDYCDSFSAQDQIRQIPLLLLGIILYAVITLMAYKKSAGSFEKLDL